MKKNKILNLKLIKNKLPKIGLNQSNIANKLNISRQAVSDWINGKDFPKASHLLKLSKLLGLSYNDLVLNTKSEEKSIIAFRKTGNSKIKEEDISLAKYLGQNLEKLAPYLEETIEPTFQELVNPKLDYEYIQEIVSKIRNKLSLETNKKISFQTLISVLSKNNITLIPVLWGELKNHRNALHIYLTKTKTTWIYLNLDCYIPDFKFWIIHEFAHILTKNLIIEDVDKAEEFADSFAGAFLFPDKLAGDLYEGLKKDKINKNDLLMRTAEEYTISPYTIYKQVESYSLFNYEKNIKDIIPVKEAGKMKNKINLKYGKVSNKIFEQKIFTPKEYISITKELFKSKIFKYLTTYIKETQKEPKFISNILHISIPDSIGLYEELIK